MKLVASRDLLDPRGHRLDQRRCVLRPAAFALRATIAMTPPFLRVQVTCTGVTLTSASQVAPLTVPVTGRCRAVLERPDRALCRRTEVAVDRDFEARADEVLLGPDHEITLVATVDASRPFGSA